MGKWEIGLGKQILRLACLKGKLEFKFLSSTVYVHLLARNQTAILSRFLFQPDAEF